uniref:Uncharacterized protein n=1 Tax=Pararge aegeria TaxID=116150 RepID=S4PEM1_9NEOP
MFTKTIEKIRIREIVFLTRLFTDTNVKLRRTEFILSNFVSKFYYLKNRDYDRDNIVNHCKWQFPRRDFVFMKLHT